MFMANKMEYRFISADDHIDLRWLPKELWTERLPARLCERGPQVVENEKGAYWTWEGQTFSPHGYYTAAQGSGAMWAIERGGVMREGELRPTTAEKTPHPFPLSSVLTYSLSLQNLS
jgi:hypothetical protein